MAHTLESKQTVTVAPNPLDKVVIIGGMPRSGTNLARRLVGSHSQIGMAGVEFSLFRKRAEGVSLQNIIGAPQFQQRYPLEVSDLYDADDRTAYQQLLLRNALHLNKAIAGEKSPRNEFYYDDILHALPDSDVFFLHMVRNPFDVLASFKNAPFRGSLDTDEATIATVATEWAQSLSLGAVRAAMNPHRYRLVVFETLTGSTASEIEAICEFLEVEPEGERMRAMPDYEGYGDNTSFRKQTSKPSKQDGKIKKLESRKDYLDPSEISIVGEICGPLAVAVGYQDEDFRRRYMTEAPGAGGSSSFVARLRKLLLR